MKWKEEITRMGQKRCIACEFLRGETTEFEYDKAFCNGCWKGDDAAENWRFRDIFLTYGKEVHALQYPDPSSALVYPVTVPSDKKELKAMMERIEESLRLKIENEKKEKEQLDSSSKEYKKLSSDISQLQGYHTRIWKIQSWS